MARVWRSSPPTPTRMSRRPTPVRRRKEKTPAPIVIDRYQFKEDGTGYLRHLRDHLYLFDLETAKAELLTPGDYDEFAPGLVPRRQPNRLRQQARRRPRSQRELRCLRHRGPTRRRARAAHPLRERRCGPLLGRPGLEPRRHGDRLPAGRTPQVPRLRPADPRDDSGRRWRAPADRHRARPRRHRCDLERRWPLAPLPARRRPQPAARPRSRGRRSGGAAHRTRGRRLVLLDGRRAHRPAADPARPARRGLRDRGRRRAPPTLRPEPRSPATGATRRRRGNLGDCVGRVRGARPAGQAARLRDRKALPARRLDPRRPGGSGRLRVRRHGPGHRRRRLSGGAAQLPRQLGTRAGVLARAVGALGRLRAHRRAGGGRPAHRGRPRRSRAGSASPAGATAG